jgi:hypothetical protein
MVLGAGYLVVGIAVKLRTSRRQNNSCHHLPAPCLRYAEKLIVVA